MPALVQKNLEKGKFAALLLQWNTHKNTRKMPWKGEKDPYKIWLSEIILQQTRVEQGLKYYTNFIEKFPTIEKLANAEDKTVFKLWEGLGYYSRCRNLIATAREIAFNKKGHFPNIYTDIIQLKGIGPYTAAAIASFAFNEPFAVIDGNVFRILARVFGIADPIDTTAGKRIFSKLATDLLNKKKPGIYNQAIMDFGATVCKPAAPLCEECPFAKNCFAYNAEAVFTLPVKAKKLQIRHRYFYFFVPHYRNTIPVRERLQKDIWQHLYEFPHIETLSEGLIADISKRAIAKAWLPKNIQIRHVSDKMIQKLTHQTIHAFFISYRLPAKGKGFSGFYWVDVATLQELAFPKIINEYLNKILFKNGKIR